MLQFLEASAGADAASLVTTVTGMAGTMLSTMAATRFWASLSVYLSPVLSLVWLVA